MPNSNNQAANIVSEHLQQDFVDLCNACSAAHRVPEHALDSGEGRLRVRPLVVRLQEFFAMQDEETKELIPSLGRRRADRIALERDERFCTFTDGQFEIRVGAIYALSPNTRLTLNCSVVFVTSGAKNGASWVFRFVTSMAVMTLGFTPHTA